MFLMPASSIFWTSLRASLISFSVNGNAAASSKASSPASVFVTNPDKLPFNVTVGIGALDNLYQSWPNVRITERGKRREFKISAVSYTHLRAHETPEHLVCRLLLEKK